MNKKKAKKRNKPVLSKPGNAFGGMKEKMSCDWMNTILCNPSVKESKEK